MSEDSDNRSDEASSSFASEESYGNVNVLRRLLDVLRNNEASMDGIRSQLR
jgi:hypothetical protein